MPKSRFIVGDLEIQWSARQAHVSERFFRTHGCKLSELHVDSDRLSSLVDLGNRLSLRFQNVVRHHSIRIALDHAVEGIVCVCPSTRPTGITDAIAIGILLVLDGLVDSARLVARLLVTSIAYCCACAPV